MRRLSVDERFWSKVIVNGDCLEYIRKGKNTVHQQFWLKEKFMGAHRYAWLYFYGSIQQGMFICHTCDNPICVNPNHLYEGTNQDNQIDAIERGQRTIFHNRNTAKTGCPYGHEYDGHNIRGDRTCSRCLARRNREYLTRKRGYQLATST